MRAVTVLLLSLSSCNYDLSCLDGAGASTVRLRSDQATVYVHECEALSGACTVAECSYSDSEGQHKIVNLLLAIDEKDPIAFCVQTCSD